MTRKKYFSYFLVGLFATGINLTTINTLWVPTQDWYLEWARLLNSGQKMYVDFAYPFTPLFSEIYRIIALAGDPLLASRVFNLLVFVVLGLGMHAVAEIFVRQYWAVILTTLLLAFWAIHPTNTIGGYYEFVTACLAWSSFFFLRNRKKFDLVASGLLCALGSLVKQNLLLVALTIFITLLLRVLKERDGIRLRIQQGFFRYSAGLGLVYLPFLIYLIINGSFFAFLTSMFGVGGKSLQLSSIALSWISNGVSLQNIAILVGISLLLFGPKNLIPIPKWIGLTSSGFLGLCTFIFVVQPMSLSFRFALFSVVSYAAVRVIKESNISKFTSRFEVKVARKVFPAILVLLVVGSWLVSNINLPLFERLLAFLKFNLPTQMWYWQSAGGYIWLIVAATIASYVLVPYLSRIKVFKETRVGTVRTIVPKSLEDSWLRTLIYALLASMVINSVNGAVSLDSNLILGVIAISMAMRLVGNSMNKLFLLFPAFFWISASVMIITLVPYQWIGWSEVKTPNVRSELPLFKNFMLTDLEERFFVEVKAAFVQLEAGDEAVSTKTIAVLPAQPILYELSSAKPFNLRCPIMHIDICSDKDAQQDLSRLRTAGPDYVVFMDLGNAINTQMDKAFRNGNQSAQSKILEFLKTGSAYKLEVSQPVEAQPNARLLYFSRIY